MSLSQHNLRAIKAGLGIEIHIHATMTLPDFALR
jgi:hypothetical protein